MRILLDTNVLGRLANPSDPFHAAAVEGIATVRERGYQPSLVPQVIYEFWVIATRPIERNGLGMSVAQTQADVSKCLTMFQFFRDERAIFDQWHVLVFSNEVHGKQAHDARLVAAMQRHEIQHLMTFNVSDFARYDGMVVVNPQSAATLATVA
jgi:predicted nucleic acid-binding protein